MEVQTKQIQEMLNKGLEDLKNKWKKNTRTAMKNTLKNGRNTMKSRMIAQ